MGHRTKAEITEIHDFAERQASYYGDAARYLGFLKLDDPVHTSSRRPGKQFIAASKGARLRRLAEAIASKPALRELVQAVQSQKSEAKLMKLFNKHRSEIQGTTVGRRLQTVRRWVVWMTTMLPS